MKLLHIGKNFVTNFLLGLKIWDEVKVGDTLFSKLSEVGDFWDFWSKSMIPQMETKNPFSVFLSWSKVPHK